MYEKIGVNREFITRGENALLFSDEGGFSDAQRVQFQAKMDSFYERFLQKVADGRDLTRDQAHAVAQGRVWTGRQAVSNGLTDEVGGLWEAVEAARRLAEIPEDTPTGLWHLPEKQNLVASLLQGDSAALAQTGRWLIYRSVREDLHQVRQSMESGALYAQPTAFSD